MDRQSIMEINKEFVKLVAENPEMPIKVFINGEYYEDDNCVGLLEKKRLNNDF